MRNNDTFLVGRFSNFQQAAEGPQLAGRMVGNQRVGNVASPKIARTEQTTAGTKFYISFLEPPGKNNNYKIFWKLESQFSAFSGPVSAAQSPVAVWVNALANQKVTFFIQTTAASGLSTPIENSPTCSGVTL